MNNRTAKKLRTIINPQDPITRKVYRRAKKQYTKTPKPLRSEFLASLNDLLSGG
tara:strand:+ start:3221 stop:3382 length:162 start_codon:yes stop_codon:yes gene_type:complete